MQPKSTFCLILALLIACSSFGQSKKRKRLRQDEIFEAGLLIGMNFSQLDGDFFTGFDKLGWYGGARGIINFTQRSSLNIEMLYSQKGSKIPHGVRLESNIEVRDRLISLNYIDVPLLFKTKLTTNPRSAFLETGPVLSRLLKSAVEERERARIPGTSYKEIEQEFKTLDVSWMIGIGINPVEHIDLSLRYSYSFSKLYLNEDYEAPFAFSSQTRQVAFLRNYFASVVLSYDLFSAKR